MTYKTTIVARLTLLVAIVSVVAIEAGRPQRSGRDSLHMILVGQALTDYDIRVYRRDSFDEMKQALRAADVTFTNLEVPIRTDEHVAAVKEGEAAHGAPPAVLDALKELGFNLLSLSNNHSWDLGAPGLLDTITEARKRGFVHAGTGRRLDEASAPAFLETSAGQVALVAMASGALLPESPAGPGRAGVNELKLENEAWNPQDQARILASITAARKKAAHVVAYQHNHYWKQDLQETPPWMKRWARQCIDAGATIFVAHGVPVLQGIEIYRGRPIFYSLGNFIFHSRGVARWPALAWRSVIADLRVERGELKALTVTPILLNEQGTVGEHFNQTRGAPLLADGEEAAAILNRLARLSRELGTELNVNRNTAELLLK
jgi:poly-gamma-glutamate capsule biosynthesis protein CapA/YwtB (metallophosphatase superfamily)